MRKAPWLAAACLLCAASARAHEHWILADTATNAEGRATVCIGSGHEFPGSDILLAERLLANMQVFGPDGEATPFKPRAAEKTWMADVAFDKPGVWGVAFALKKPQEDEPLYCGRCLTVVGAADDPARYVTGKGLELVPKAPLSALTPGASLPVAIHLDGAPVEGTIAVTSEKGAASFYSTGKARPAEIKLPSNGAYLLTVSRKGKTFALTFSVVGAAP